MRFLEITTCPGKYMYWHYRLHPDLGRAPYVRQKAEFLADGVGAGLRMARGMGLLGTALMLNGIAMEICGSSRPASGGEHLISHALDAIAARPRLHGLQAGLASYVVSRLQGGADTPTISLAFHKTGFWDEVKKDPFSRAEWLEAVRLAPSMKDDFFTVLSLRDCLPEVESMLADDPALQGCFR